MPAPVYRSSSVEPIVPVANNFGPEIITHGMAALAQVAAERQKLQLESEQQITDAALKSRQLDIARENNLLDYRLKSELIPFQKQLLTAHADSFQSTEKASATTELNLANYRQTVANEIADFQNELQKRDLLNPNPTNPMQAYADYADLANEFQNAQIPQIQTVITNLKAHFEGMKVPLVAYGANPDPSDPKKWVGGAPKQFSPGQIIAHLQDPATNQLMTNSLRASGVIVPTEKTKTQSGEEVMTDYRAKPWLENYINQSRGVTMKPHSEPRPGISQAAKWMAVSGIGTSRSDAPNSAQKVRVMSSEGVTGFIPATQLDAALKAGYKQMDNAPAVAEPALPVATDAGAEDGTITPNDSTDGQ